jgi:hypothetical protein
LSKLLKQSGLEILETYGDFMKIPFDPTIPKYYKRFGWRKIGMDEFKSPHVMVMEVEL